MQLIGRLDSPYVRRTAISMTELGVRFDHLSISVFSEADHFKRINPVIRAPTLVLDDGTMLMDSSAIIEYFDRSSEASLWPALEPARTHNASTLGYTLSACDKAVQLVYERNLRPLDKQFGIWSERVHRQVDDSCHLLEGAVTQMGIWLEPERLTQAGISLAVAITFMQDMLPDVWTEGRFPKLRAFNATAEALPVFHRWPYSE